MTVPHVPGGAVLTAAERRGLECARARWGQSGAQFRSLVEGPSFDLYVELRDRRDELATRALSSAGERGPDWLARETVEYLRGSDWAISDALALCVAAGAGGPGAVQALLGPVLVCQSQRMMDEALRGEQSYRAAYETLYGLVRRLYDEPACTSIALLAAVAVAMAGSRLLVGEGAVQVSGALARRALAWCSRERGAGAGTGAGSRTFEHTAASRDRVLYEAALAAAGRPYAGTTAAFLDAALVLGAMLDDLGSTAYRATLADRFSTLSDLVADLPPDLQGYAAARVADLAESGLALGEWLPGGPGTPVPTPEGPADRLSAARVRTDGRRLSVLMIGYCFFGSGGEHLIGVYKRLVRIGMELVARGHQVNLIVPGRERYRDPLVDQAARTPSFSFVDPAPRDRGSAGAAVADLDTYRACISAMAPDVVVIGDGPLSGRMLEATLAAAHCDAPIVIVDNLYSPGTVGDSLRKHGPVADALLLVGPSSHELRPAPPHVRYAPPFAPHPETLDGCVQGVLGDDRPSLTVLAYDPGVLRLGLGLARELGPAYGPVVIVGPDPAKTAEAAASCGVPPGTVVALPPVPEDVLFGLLHESRLAVVKAGFMQITECLSLGTPVVALRYDDFAIRWLPLATQRCIVTALAPDPDPFVLRGARRLLDTRARADGVHDGTFGGVAIAAERIEHVASCGKRATLGDCSRAGVEPGAVANALRAWWAVPDLDLLSLRCTHVDGSRDFDVYAAVAHARAGPDDRRVPLAVRVFRDTATADRWWVERRRGLPRHRTRQPSVARTAGRDHEPYVEGRVIVDAWRGQRELREPARSTSSHDRGAESQRR